MTNETIVLYAEDKELMREVRHALVEKLWCWRESVEDFDNCVVVWRDNAVATYPIHCVAGDYTRFDLSRTDLLTMFLLG